MLYKYSILLHLWKLTQAAVDAVWSHPDTGWWHCWRWHSAVSFLQKLLLADDWPHPRFLPFSWEHPTSKWLVNVVVLRLHLFTPTWDNPVGQAETFFSAHSCFLLSPHSCYSWEHDNSPLWVCFLGKLIFSYWSQELSVAKQVLNGLSGLHLPSYWPLLVVGGVSVFSGTG